MAPLEPGSTIYERVSHHLLSQLGGIGVDMHFHTRYSDGTARVEEAVRRAHNYGLGLAITDHNEVRGALEAVRLAEGQVFILPGIEVNCWEGCDLLAYFSTTKDLVRFYEAEVAPFRGVNPAGRIHRGLVHVAEGARRHGGVVSAAHPYGMMGGKNLHRWVQRNGSKLLDSISLVETNNGTLHQRSNSSAEGWARQLGRPATGGSDGHTLFELGQVVTWSAGRTPAEFLEAVLGGEGVVLGRRMSLAARVTSGLQIARRHALYAVPGVRAFIRRIDARAKLAGKRILQSHPHLATLLDPVDPAILDRTEDDAAEAPVTL